MSCSVCHRELLGWQIVRVQLPPSSSSSTSASSAAASASTTSAPPATSATATLANSPAASTASTASSAAPTAVASATHNSSSSHHQQHLHPQSSAAGESAAAAAAAVAEPEIVVQCRTCIAAYNQVPGRPPLVVLPGSGTPNRANPPPPLSSIPGAGASAGGATSPKSPTYATVSRGRSIRDKSGDGTSSSSTSFKSNLQRIVGGSLRGPAGRSFAAAAAASASSAEDGQEPLSPTSPKSPISPLSPSKRAPLSANFFDRPSDASASQPYASPNARAGGSPSTVRKVASASPSDDAAKRIPMDRTAPSWARMFGSERASMITDSRSSRSSSDTSSMGGSNSSLNRPDSGYVIYADVEIGRPTRASSSSAIYSTIEDLQVNSSPTSTTGANPRKSATSSAIGSDRSSTTSTASSSSSTSSSSSAPVSPASSKSPKRTSKVISDAAVKFGGLVGSPNPKPPKPAKPPKATASPAFFTPSASTGRPVSLTRVNVPAESSPTAAAADAAPARAPAPAPTPTATPTPETVKPVVAGTSDTAPPNNLGQPVRVKSPPPKRPVPGSAAAKGPAPALPAAAAGTNSAHTDEHSSTATIASATTAGSTQPPASDSSISLSESLPRSGNQTATRLDFDEPTTASLAAFAFRAAAIHSFAASRTDELSMSENDTIQVDQCPDPDWWIGRNLTTKAGPGWFPANHVQKMDAVAARKSKIAIPDRFSRMSAVLVDLYLPQLEVDFDEIVDLFKHTNENDDDMPDSLYENWDITGRVREHSDSDQPREFSDLETKLQDIYVSTRDLNLPEKAAKDPVKEAAVDALLMDLLGYTVEAKAVYSFTATRNDELSFQAGDMLRLLNQEDDDWWQGQLRDKIGWFPSNHCVIESSKGRPASPAALDEPKSPTLTASSPAKVLPRRGPPAPAAKAVAPDFLDPLFAREMKNERIARVRVCDFEKRSEPKFYMYMLAVTTSRGVYFIYRRYSEFFQFYEQMVEAFPEAAFPPFPGKILFGRSHVRSVTVTRMKDLDAFMQGLLSMPEHVSQSNTVLEFLAMTVRDRQDTSRRNDRFLTSQRAGE